MNPDRRFLLVYATKVFSLLLMFGYTIVVLMTWFNAFFHNDMVLILINYFGERDAELLMWIGLTPVLGYGLLLLLGDLQREGFMNRHRIRRALGRDSVIEWL